MTRENNFRRHIWVRITILVALSLIWFIIGWNSHYVLHSTIFEGTYHTNDETTINITSTNNITLNNELIYFPNVSYMTYFGKHSPIINKSLDKLFYDDTRYQNNSIHCQGIQIQGLAKSGTTWLEYVIYLIVKHVCNSSLFINNEKDISNVLCNAPASFSSYNVEKGANTRPYKYPKYPIWVRNKHSINSNPPGNIRWCKIVMFRPPRDRLFSSIHFQRRTHDAKGQNRYAMTDYKRFISVYKNWYTYYKGRMDKESFKYFMVSYQDLSLRSLYIVELITKWLKYDTYFSSNDYKYISEMISWNSLVKRDKSPNHETVNTYRGQHSSNATMRICQFWRLWTANTIQTINNALRNSFDEDFLRKFNQTCPI